ncbi:MAG TPA: hypothetical protein VLA82_09860 [Actinomycetota bacterium]|nr:hypothetical protein [Actinomycetota bacterium]
MRAGLLAHAGGADESLAIAMVFAALWIGWMGWSRVRGTGFPRLPRGAGFGLLGAAIVVLLASAVVPGAVFGPTPSPTPAAGGQPTGDRPASTATLSIVAPLDGETLTSDELEVVMDLQGGRVVEAASTQLSPDEGHIHLSIDGEVVSMTYGTVQVLDLRSLAPGSHVLEAEFVAADHAPFSPRVLSKVSFTNGIDG